MGKPDRRLGHDHGSLTEIPHPERHGLRKVQRRKARSRLPRNPVQAPAEDTRIVRRQMSDATTQTGQKE
jgi:hypothetical protein